MTQTGSERRHEPRIEEIDFISVSEFRPETFRTLVTLGQTTDISHNGLRLELSHAIPLRSEISLSLGLGDDILDLKGKVRSLRVIDETTCSMGIEFIDVPAESREKLDAFLTQYA